MIGELVIHKSTEAAFKKHCAEFDINIRCIQEGIDGDRWEVEFEEISDIYGLGQMVGTDTLIEFQNKNG